MNFAEDNDRFCDNWLNILIDGAKKGVTEPLKACAAFHFRQLKTDDPVDCYIGKPREFLTFLSKQWRWKITVFDRGKRIVIDEDKPQCVCPIVTRSANIASSLCRCEEYFARLMFSRVYGRTVTARVLHSVLRGDKTCVYEIIVEEKE